MSLTLKLLRAYLGLGVDPPADQQQEPDPAAGASDPPDQSADDDLPDLDAPDSPDDDGGGEEPDHQKLLQAANERAERAERERDDARRAREDIERRSAAPRGPTEEQTLLEQEEAILKDPKSTEQQRYWVQANRTLRENKRMAQQALWQSQEAADQAAYAQLMRDKPLAKKYEKRVEEKLAEVRKDGHNLPRRLALAMLIGTDIVDGKVKTTKKTVAAGGEQQTQRVDRGSPPRARGDVRGRTGTSEHEKRRARLENQAI